MFFSETSLRWSEGNIRAIEKEREGIWQIHKRIWESSDMENIDFNKAVTCVCVRTFFPGSRQMQKQ